MKKDVLEEVVKTSQTVKVNGKEVEIKYLTFRDLPTAAKLLAKFFKVTAAGDDSEVVMFIAEALDSEYDQVVKLIASCTGLEHGDILTLDLNTATELAFSAYEVNKDFLSQNRLFKMFLVKEMKDPAELGEDASKN